MVKITLEALDVNLLAAALRQGDETAFRQLFEALYSPLVSYAAGLLRDRQAAEDLVQDAFVRLWRTRESVDPERSVRALLFVTVRNLTLNAIRRRSNHQRILMTMSTDDMQPPGHGSYDADRLRERLRRWIDGLPEREQEAFRLSRFADLTHDEIAEVMEISKATVEKHITNALRKLRDKLKAFDPEILKS